MSGTRHHMGVQLYSSFCLRKWLPDRVTLHTVNDVVFWSSLSWAAALLHVSEEPHTLGVFSLSETTFENNVQRCV
jgi:hypothetical protein